MNLRPIHHDASIEAPTGQPTVSRFDGHLIEPEPWANGKGVTRTIARGGLDGETQWRVSLATLNGAAEFSRFEGFERILLPVDAQTLQLQSTEGQLIAHRNHPAHFSGDLRVWIAALPRPVEVLNVMTRRGSSRTRLEVFTQTASVNSACVHLLLGLAGQWTVRGTRLGDVVLGPLQGLLIENVDDALTCEAAAAAADTTTGSAPALASIAIEAPGL
jgi:environmental stress-induced protein Ves